MGKIRFALALHNHQPVGNFDNVFESAYEESYRPFLDVIEKYPEIPFALHTSGCLLEYLVERHPDYVDRLKGLVRSGQLEILGGAYYEPILPNIPSRDRRGQIRGYSEYLQELFDQKIRGMWIAERVWEQCLVGDIHEAGIEYTILDDYHFQKAGLRPELLHGYYLSEDEGKLIRIFPGSEPMRYYIPFLDPDAVIRYLGEVRERNENAVVVFADDGEKFGSWPETYAHVYQDGWIYRFLDALRANQDWIEVCTPSQAVDALEPLGTIYLPDCSYREMTEWSLPAERLQEYDSLWRELEHQSEGGRLRSFMKGGFWRNFRVKYAESKEMYSRMMQISERLDRLTRQEPAAFSDHRVHQARQELYRGQCNCTYWHGAFGGLYLPHLRNAIYRHLIEAEKWLENYDRSDVGDYVEVQVRDLNFDSHPEVRLENKRMTAFLAPANGGHLYELDLREVGVNLGASLGRRPEAYHEKIRNAVAGADGKNVASIHDRVVLKQEGLDRLIAYDWYERKSLVDHFFEPDVTADQLMTCTYRELSDFVQCGFNHQVQRSGDKAVVTMTRHGNIEGHPVSLTKAVELTAANDRLQVRYRLEGLPDRELHFGVEFNFAAMAAGADDRYYHQNQDRLGPLDSVLTLDARDELSLFDDWLGLNVTISSSQPAEFFTLPVQSVSQSEGGFELVHQSACVIPHWRIPAGSGPVWEVQLVLDLDASLAESRRPQSEAGAMKSEGA